MAAILLGISLNKNVWILIKISKFVLKDPINNISA